MSNPITTLFRSGFREICRSELEAGRDVLEPYFSMAAIDKLFASIGPRPGWLKLPEQNLFHVYLFLKWHEIFVDGKPVGPPPQTAMRVVSSPESPRITRRVEHPGEVPPASVEPDGR